jgi:hypothetical protein
MTKRSHSKILDNIKNNSKHLDVFDNVFREKAEHNKTKVLADFFIQVAKVNGGQGCLPSEAELILEPFVDGDKVGWRIYLAPMDRKEGLITV